MDTQVTAPGKLSVINPARTAIALAIGTDADHPLAGPRIRLMAARPAVSPTSVTLTSILVQWRAADAVDGGGRDLIREIEGR